MCGFWLWEEHETEARRHLAASMSPDPQTPSRLRQSSMDSRSQSSPSTGLRSLILGNPNSATASRMLGSARQETPTSSQSDRVLRNARQATPTPSQATRSSPRPQTPDLEDELATTVINLLESYKIQLSSKEQRKLRVVIDDYVDDLVTELCLCKAQLDAFQGPDEDGYVVD